jgi:ABC-type dipeptide/oligopeptide/nickel transport system permease subunit
MASSIPAPVTRPVRLRGVGLRWDLNRTASIGILLGLAILVAALVAPWLARLEPFEQSAVNRLAAPDSVHILGRDTFGRDIFARVLYAARISLTVGVGSVALGAVLAPLGWSPALRGAGPKARSCAAWTF